MADNKQAPGAGEAAPTAAEYKKAQARVRELVEKRRGLDRKLNQVEDSIAQKETAYLDSTPSGNVITGFDNYMKGTSGAAAQRRKVGSTEQNRVFTRSSISYRPSTGDTPGSTPASHAPTPISASFREGGSANATPTSAAGTKNAKKKKETEDSGTDTGTKKRTNFGARK
ncbi:NuA4-domain-containing protein [Sarocladium strictum]